MIGVIELELCFARTARSVLLEEYGETVKGSTIAFHFAKRAPARLSLSEADSPVAIAKNHDRVYKVVGIYSVNNL